MALVNHAKREINAKIVYFGPEGTGKATSVRYVYDRIKPSLRGELKNLPASGASLLFFDFSPFEQPVFAGYRLRLHIYTLQGNVANPAAWKMTLKGADGLVIVADASPAGFIPLQESLERLRQYLAAYGVGREDIPSVLQLNKADLGNPVQPGAVARETGIAEELVCLTSALSGERVLETLAALSRLILERLRHRDDMRMAGAEAPAEGQTAAEPENNDAAGSAGPVEDRSAGADGGETVPMRVVMTEEGIRVEGGTVRIPLKLTGAAEAHHLVVTVTVAPGDVESH